MLSKSQNKENYRTRRISEHAICTHTHTRVSIFHPSNQITEKIIFHLIHDTKNIFILEIYLAHYAHEVINSARTRQSEVLEVSTITLTQVSKQNLLFNKIKIKNPVTLSFK